MPEPAFGSSPSHSCLVSSVVLPVSRVDPPGCLFCRWGAGGREAHLQVPPRWLKKSEFSLEVQRVGTSLVAQWLTVCPAMQGIRVPALRGGSWVTRVPGAAELLSLSTATRVRALQWRAHLTQLLNPRAATQAWRGRISEYLKNKKLDYFSCLGDYVERMSEPVLPWNNWWKTQVLGYGFCSGYGLCLAKINSSLTLGNQIGLLYEKT